MTSEAPLPLDETACWRAVQSRDARFDGRFFTAVRTTGIYCRPVCPARTPLQRNVRFFRSAAAAEGAGFRPCRRCRPEAAPGTPAWEGTGAVAGRALRLIQAGALDAAGVDDLAARLGMGSRHLRRLLVEHAGVPPQQLALTRRLHFARRLLDETRLPLEAIASASGFGSSRRFRDAFRSSFGLAPSSLRRAGRAAGERGADVELHLAWRPPLPVRSLLGFLAPRAIPGCERVEGLAWTSSARFCGVTGLVEARFDEDARVVRVRAPAAFAPHLMEITARLRRLFDLDSDPAAIGARLAADPLLKPLVKRRPGLRSPGAFEPFTAAVRSVLGQQVSVAAATTIAGRIARAFGTPVAASAGIDRVFPDAATLAEAPLERCGLPSRRAETLRRLARGVAEGRPLLHESGREELLAIPGIGPWTASVIALRTGADPDAFPAGDLVIARALGGARRAEERAEAWRPFRAYAAMHLWTAAAEGATT